MTADSHTSAQNSGVIVFDKCETIERQRDSIYETSFIQRLKCPSVVQTVPYTGYLRALQLYGNEDAFDLTQDERENLMNCKNLEFCRSLARNQGYNPESGNTAPWAGVYFPLQFIQTYPGPRMIALEPDVEEQTLPSEQTLSSMEAEGQSSFLATETTQEIKMAEETSLIRFSNLQLCDPVKPATLRGMSGSRVPTADDFGNTCVGGLEMAVVVTELLEGAVKGNFDVEWRRAIEDTLDYIGGSENMAAFLDMIYKKFPKKEDTSVASTIGRRLRGSE
ncbi:hypothetical protein FPRO06_06907 [Fusarium proliferatum]|uniref:Uncharacterized protein n=2 Tax=Gibberella intermedia TaxID=948311 RepID=A0A365N2T5_GIBIN|nr:uncharacterized protein FPRO_06252 [Fusarium proliferatum ET1]KAG4256305.1 hypothetical protein FPRO03_05253 [Fusarium proliferatum]KAI1067246.1 hypothetical protein LB506_004448 [Fusarium annulatum]KAG4285647.1 hypothetical protein FPRO06_06907 [Fusarium proliferatum]RBA15114.1 hypothetical protein FPRO05_12954 [Fusarium proliferatum]RKL25136.1 hypothetical protein BFJ72_g14082 [Fusarium proliferatum]